MRDRDKEIKDLLDKIFELIESDLKKPTKLMESNALDIPIQSTLILQKMLLARFGKNEKLLLSSIKEIMQITIRYYNTLHAKKLGFVIRLKNKFFN